MCLETQSQGYILFSYHIYLVSYKTGFYPSKITTINMELNDLRIINCLRKSEVTVGRISVYNVIEKLIEHGIDCLPSSYTNDVIDLLL